MYSPANSTSFNHDSWNTSSPNAGGALVPVEVGVVDDDAGLDELEHAASTADRPPAPSSATPALPIAPRRKNDRRSSDKLLRSKPSATIASPASDALTYSGPRQTAVGRNPRRSLVSALAPQHERRVSISAEKLGGAMITPMRDLATLPKAHLHVHLEGAMRPDTLRDLAGDLGVEVPQIRGYGNFSAFAGMYVAACDVLASADAMQRLVREVVEDAALDGAVWLEPAIYLPRH